MASKTKDEIKAFFQTGDKPTESQFIDLIDSYVDKSGPIGGLETLVSGNGLGVVYTSGGRCEILSPATLRGLQSISVYTTALASGVAVASIPYATTAQAIAGSAANVVMNPILVRNVVDNIASSTSALIALKTVTASNVSSVDFVNGSGGVVLDGTYRSYIVKYSSVVPASDGAELWFRTSTNAGSSYDTTNSYAYGGFMQAAGSVASDSSGNNASQIVISENVGNDTGEGISGTISIYYPSDATRKHHFTYDSSYIRSTGQQGVTKGGGANLNTADIDAIRFLFSTGNISSGTFTLYGLL